MRLLLPLPIPSFITYKYDSEHVKVISELLDKGHEALLHLTALMDQVVRDDAVYAAQFAPLDALVRDYAVKPSDAFHALRRVLHLSNMQGAGEEGGANGSGMEIDAGAGSPPSASAYSRLITSVRSFYPSSTWSALTPSFYSLFWRLSLAQLHVPAATYESHSAKLRALMPALDNATTNAGLAKTELQKKQCRTEKERLQKLIKDLGAELSAQSAAVDASLKELQAQKDRWFDDSVTAHAQSMSSFLEVCVLPRVLHSGIDAHYTAKFIQTIVKLNTKHFLYLDFFEQVRAAPQRHHLAWHGMAWRARTHATSHPTAQSTSLIMFVFSCVLL